MTLLAFVAVTAVGWGLLVYVIVHLLADNRRLTAAALAPRPEQAARIITAEPSKQRAERDDTRPVRAIGA